MVTVIVMNSFFWNLGLWSSGFRAWDLKRAGDLAFGV